MALEILNSQKETMQTSLKECVSKLNKTQENLNSLQQSKVELLRFHDQAQGALAAIEEAISKIGGGVTAVAEGVVSAVEAVKNAL